MLDAIALAIVLAGAPGKLPMGTTEHLKDFAVIELRRYAVREHQRDEFALYFESYFPEAFQQLGSLIHGQFLERGNPEGFTWIRGFHDMDARAAVNGAFYGGPLWKEHSSTMNDRLLDHTNVLLLRPIEPARGVSILPAVDPVSETEGARGIVVAQIFSVAEGAIDAFAPRAESFFAQYRAQGAREAGVLVTLDAPNNFPRLPFRTDGPYLVWLGIAKDEASLQAELAPLFERSAAALSKGGLLRGEPELAVLVPTRRSRLRWR
jgi:hypothetical protein